MIRPHPQDTLYDRLDAHRGQHPVDPDRRDLIA
jgi:hypothetical protein